MRVVGSDATDIKTVTDSLGNYIFSNCFNLQAKYLATSDVSTIKDEHKGIVYGLCPHAWYDDYGYLTSSSRHKFSFSDSLPIQNFDDCLSPIYGCGFTFPDFNFKKNTTDFLPTKWMDISATDTSVDCFVALLMAKKNFTIEISGHASSDEENKKELSSARAKKLYDLLVSKGIKPGRLKFQGYSDKYPIEFNNEYGEIVQKSVTETNEKSRRVVFSVLSKDYVPKETTEAEQTPVKLEDDNEGE